MYICEHVTKKHVCKLHVKKGAEAPKTTSYEKDFDFAIKLRALGNCSLR